MSMFENPFKDKEKKKTVGDILKEKGIIKPLPQKKEEVTPEPKDKSDSRLFMEIEKIKAELQMLKDSNQHTDDRIRDVTEKIGEFRSLVFQRETMIKESESKIRLLEDEIFSIKPRIIEKEMESRKKEIEDVHMKIEKLDAMIRDVLKDVKKSKETLEKIKSVENIEKMLDETRKRVEITEKAKNEVDIMAGKTERLYMEMNERMKDFITIKAKMENQEEFSKEMTKSIDSINIRMGSFSGKEEMDNFKKSVSNTIGKNTEKVISRISELEKYVMIPEEESKKKIEELEKKEEEISKLLNDLEDNYKKAGISEKTYKETREKNEKFLEDIARQINETREEEIFEIKSLPATIKNLKIRIGKMEGYTNSIREEVISHRNFLGNNVKEIHERIDNVEDQGSAHEEYKGTLKNQTDLMRSTLEAIKKLNEKMNKISVDVGIFDLRIRFFECVTMLIRVQTKEEITFYISELNKIIGEMKSRNIWNDTKEKMVLGLLSDISHNWKEFEYHNIALIFDEEIKKFQRPSK